jgi:flagellar motor component MotA
MNIRSSSALVLLVVIVLAAIMMESNLWAFVDVRTLMLVLGISLGGTLWLNSVNDFLESCRDWLANEELDEAGRERSHRVFTQMANFTVAGGVIGVLIGLIQMLQNLSDPTAIGPSMAGALLSLLYAVLFGEILLRAVAEDCLSRDKSTAN